MNDYKSLPNFISSFLIFYGFSKLKFKSNKVINWIGSSTLAVYIIHQTPIFYPILWKYICSVDFYINKNIFIFIIYYLVVIFGTFFSCIFIDKIRLAIMKKTSLDNKVNDYCEVLFTRLKNLIISG